MCGHAPVRATSMRVQCACISQLQGCGVCVCGGGGEGRTPGNCPQSGTQTGRVRSVYDRVYSDGH